MSRLKSGAFYLGLLVMTFDVVNNLDPDQSQQNVQTVWHTLIGYSWRKFCKNNSILQKNIPNYSACKELKLSVLAAPFCLFSSWSGSKPFDALIEFSKEFVEKVDFETGRQIRTKVWNITQFAKSQTTVPEGTNFHMSKLILETRIFLIPVSDWKCF